ncbi:hypothetical protein CMT92_07315 [Elizabethkingia anophelis]|uniref:hypothetical protein n=1 Tax=Elizabethkingia anophelis TaxID=1117645 RepID=UPI0021A8643E|nr:hypothetical protein [Elizabethkingia anophelis]MCT3871764.1 hypothetical protein [Elizabethkingia anophelis]MDV3847460.1 hypothetical protein [Elizabethkingia anophelis]
MENKLIPMTEFTLQKCKFLEIESNDDLKLNMESHFSLLSIRRYTQFLKQSLALWMLVPVDKNGNIIEFIEYEAWTGSDDHYNEYMNVYLEAYERVLFEGFKVVDYWIENEYGEHLIDLDALTAFSIEDLANWQCDIELTETAKQIYGS